MSFKNSIYAAINIIGTLFLVYAGAESIISIANHGLLAHVPLTFLWGSYSPSSVATLETVIAYFVWYKKFWPKNIFFFAFIWGASDIVFNILYDAYHLPQLLAGPKPWQIGSNYLEIMVIEGIIALVGYVVLRPKFRWEPSLITYFAITLLLGGYLYSFATGYQVVSDPKYSTSLVLYFLEFIENAALMVLLYRSAYVDETLFNQDLDAL